MFKINSFKSLLNRQLVLNLKNDLDSTAKLSSTIKSNSNIRYYSSDESKEKPLISTDIESDLKKLKEVRQELANNDSNIYNEYKQQEKGFIYDKKPVKVKCKKGKIYMWCACGHSKHQPFCDGTHRIAHYKITLKPFPFTAKEDKEYWFCNCKQSNNRPLCDGTHKEDFVKNAKSTIKC